MKRLVHASATVLPLVLLASGAAAQTSKDLVGTWMAVSFVADQGGNKVEPFGSNPKGILTFSESGRYTVILLRSDLPKFASNNRVTGTPEENKAVVQGSIAHFGTYSAEGDKIVFRVEAATYPNWNGAEQIRSFTLTENELRYTIPVGSAGGTSYLVWKRAK